MIKLICYDVNGTIFNDTELFFRAINGVFARFGISPMPLAQLKRKFGQPWTKLYREAGITASDARLYEIYNELYSAEKPLVFSDLEPTLIYLQTREIKVGIVSTQQNALTIPLLENSGIRSYFQAIEGSVSDKSAVLCKVAKKFELGPKETAYVGDQVGDIVQAKSAGCTSIGFIGGIHSEAKLSAAQPNYILRSHIDLINLPIFD
ncbi:MAG: HAD family hydrolase [Nitrospiria bacterium]